MCSALELSIGKIEHFLEKFGTIVFSSGILGRIFGTFVVNFRTVMFSFGILYGKSEHFH